MDQNLSEVHLNILYMSRNMRFPTICDFFNMNRLSLILSLETPNDGQSVA